jgi:hypothetical protein
MTDQRHTPGPWQAIATNRSGSKDAWDGFEIRNLHEHIATARGPGKDETRQADAHLIAASPDMYEALAGLIVAWGSDETVNQEDFIASCYSIMPHARAAIVKAEGKQDD